ncbi:MAG: hypothetical protein WAM39_21515, partial [Bryobacteraceae bacterium]
MFRNQTGHAVSRLDLRSKDPGGFQQGGSLAGNDSSELSSTISIDSEAREVWRLNRQRRSTAAVRAAKPSTQLRRRRIAILSSIISLKPFASRLLLYRPPKFLLNAVQSAFNLAASLSII